MLTFRELAWAAYVYAVVTKGDKNYWEVEAQRRRIDDFVKAPSQSDLDMIKEVVIRQFLNDWGRCRIPEVKVGRIASEIEHELERLDAAEREALSALSIRDVGADRLSDSTAARIKNLYDAIDDIDGCGPTVVSKILFVLFPKLCMMWDGFIRDHLKTCQQPIRRDDGQGYVCFLHHCGEEMARSVSDHFRTILGQSDTPEDYLSSRLYPGKQRKTLAKYLDEYLWIKITNIDQIDEHDMPFDLLPPPKWLTSLPHS